MAACMVTGCTTDGAWHWERWATPDEVTALRPSKDLPEKETSARLVVLACDLHKLSLPDGAPDLELMAPTHDATCTAPPACDCTAKRASRTGEESTQE